MPDKYNYKDKFLAQKNGNNDVANLLTHCHRFELKLAKELNQEKDICEFTVEQFTNLLEYLLNDENLEIGNVQKQVTYLKQYLAFCSDKSNHPLQEQDIDKVINENGGVRKWLAKLTAPEDSDNLLSLNELLSLEYKANRKIVTNQVLAFVWLLFIGLKIKEIRYIKEYDINDWDKWYRKDVELPADVRGKVSSILSLASKQEGIIRKSRSGGQKPYRYKQSDYFFKSPNKEGGPIPTVTLDNYFDEIKNTLGKKRLRQVNIRKSGMLYFGCLQHKHEPIRTFPEMKSLIYKPICKMFNVGKTYETELRKLFASSVVTTFYGLEPITQLESSSSSFQSSNGKAVHDVTDQPPKRPKARKRDGPKSWQQNAQRGEKGESLVLSWIKDKRHYDPNACQVEDSKGYDIYAKINNEVRLIEVKTMENIPSVIYITRHEYEVAHRKSKYYWFYIVVLGNTEKNNPVAYTFKDLLSLLGLQDKEQELFKHPKYNIKYDSFSICLDANVFEKCNQIIKLQ